MSKYNKTAVFTGKKAYKAQTKWTDKQNAGYNWQGRDDELEFNSKKIKTKQSSFRKSILRRHLKQRDNHLNNIVLTLHTLNNADFNIPDNKFEIIEIIPYTLYRWYATNYEFRLEYISLEKRNIFVRQRKDYEPKHYNKFSSYGTYGSFGAGYGSMRGSYYSNSYDEEYIHLGTYDKFTNIPKVELIEGVLRLLQNFYKYCAANKPISTFDDLIS